MPKPNLPFCHTHVCCKNINHLTSSTVTEHPSFFKFFNHLLSLLFLSAGTLKGLIIHSQSLKWS